MVNSISLPPVEVIEQFLEYDSETGILSWKVSRGSRKAGEQAGYIHADGYITVFFKKRLIKAHRLAWLLHTREDPQAMHIDHINGIKTDNRLSNLRLATRWQNQWNKGKGITNTSGYKGVSFNKHKKKWHANIRVYGRQKHLGYFDTPELAHMAYAKAAAELHGDFARAA